MTNNEKFLLIALIDNSISQLQVLRGAVSMMGKKEEIEKVTESIKSQENLFGQRFESMLNGIEQGDENGAVNE